jgi:hypothetical protein
MSHSLLGRRRGEEIESPERLRTKGSGREEPSQPKEHFEKETG